MPLIASTPSASSGSFTVTFTDWLINDPTSAANPIVLKDVTGINFAESENVQWFEPIGSNRAISVSDEILGVKIDATLEFYNEADFLAVRSLRQQQKTLLLRDPWGHGWFVRFNEGFSWQQKTGGGTNPYRVVSCSFTEVAEP